MKNNKRQVYIALAIILILFIFSFVLFCAFGDFFNKNDSKVNQNVLNVNLENGKGLFLKNTLPLSDQLGKEFDGTGVEEGIQGYKEFSVENTSSQDVSYEI